MRHNLAESRRKARRDFALLFSSPMEGTPEPESRAQEPLNHPESRDHLHGQRALVTCRRAEPDAPRRPWLSFGAPDAPIHGHQNSPRAASTRTRQGSRRVGRLVREGNAEAQSLAGHCPDTTRTATPRSMRVVDSTCRCRLLLSGETEAMNKTRDPRLWNTAFPVSTQSLSKLSRVEKSACQHPLGS